MNRYYYDFHVHSCLSPCADDDMTPNNIVGMATLAGLNIVALTDHNSTRNCPAFFAAAKKHGVIPVAGMELTTAEDIHVVCLFEHLDDAMSFGEEVEGHRVRFKNRVDVYGQQMIMDENDEVVAVEEDLLSNATTIRIEEVRPMVKRHGGVCWPAHVDREANGIVATLGCFPEDLGFSVAEFCDDAKIAPYQEKYPPLERVRAVVGSDAHYLWDIRDKKHYFELEDEPYSSALVRKNLFLALGGDET